MKKSFLKSIEWVETLVGISSEVDFSPVAKAWKCRTVKIIQFEKLGSFLV